MYIVIIFLPLLNFILGIFGRVLGSKILIYSIICNLIICWILSAIIFYEVVISGHFCEVVLSKWIESGLLEVNWGFLFDTLSVSMLLLVFTISLIVHLYSLEYMAEDAHKERFFCYLSLFTFFMCFLVSANNFLGMFLGWEGVGLASFLLINFWFKRIEANKASIKAMLVNRVGDFGLALGIILIFIIFKTLNYNEIFCLVYKFELTNFVFLGFELKILTLIGFLLFIGVMAKSAQLGLHTWLADAMEGPTPVSALIHAATMVTAGVFLLIRCSPLIEYSGFILKIIAVVGAITALVSALIGVFQQDIKKIIAFSTCSQLGFMVAACGFSQYSLAFAHLVNHAFFKALLFLTAGLLIHTFHDEQDINRFGNVAVLFPLCYAFMLIGSVSLVGFPFLTGFYSKHLILEIIYVNFLPYQVFVFFLLLIATFLTSVYSTKLLIKAYIMPNNSFRYYLTDWHHSPIILFCLSFLCLLSIYGGYILSDFFLGFSNCLWGNSIFNRYNLVNNISIEFLPRFISFSPLILSILGAVLVVLFYLNKNFYLKISLNSYILSLSDFFFEGCYFNRIYNRYIVRPLMRCAYIVYKDIDKGFLSVWGPTRIEDFTLYFSRLVVRFQTGLLYHYICWIVLGVVFLLFINYIWYFIVLFIIFFLFIFLNFIFLYFIMFFWNKFRKLRVFKILI
jgi:proton-translocating NADH-quinone oxidoreductase chain L